jgi:hypothetical protein
MRFAGDVLAADEIERTGGSMNHCRACQLPEMMKPSRAVSSASDGVSLHKMPYTRHRRILLANFREIFAGSCVGGRDFE